MTFQVKFASMRPHESTRVCVLYLFSLRPFLRRERERGGGEGKSGGNCSYTGPRMDGSQTWEKQGARCTRARAAVVRFFLGFQLSERHVCVGPYLYIYAPHVCTCGFVVWTTEADQISLELWENR